MTVNKAEWAALNAAIGVAENISAEWQSPQGLALKARIIAARAILTDTVPDEEKPKGSYLPSRHPARNN